MPTAAKPAWPAAVQFHGSRATDEASSAFDCRSASASSSWSRCLIPSGSWRRGGLRNVLRRAASESSSGMAPFQSRVKNLSGRFWLNLTVPRRTE